MNEKFKEAYEGLPRRDSLNLQRELIGQLGWSRDLFYKRLNNERKLKADELPSLIAIFKKFGIDIMQ